MDRNAIVGIVLSSVMLAVAFLLIEKLTPESKFPLKLIFYVLSALVWFLYVSKFLP